MRKETNIDKLPLNEAHIVWENRSYIMAMKGDIEYIKNDIADIKSAMRDITVKLEEHFVTRGELERALKPIKEKSDSMSMNVGKVVMAIILAVVGAVLALLFK